MDLNSCSKPLMTPRTKIAASLKWLYNISLTILPSEVLSLGTSQVDSLKRKRLRSKICLKNNYTSRLTWDIFNSFGSFRSDCHPWYLLFLFKYLRLNLIFFEFFEIFCLQFALLKHQREKLIKEFFLELFLVENIINLYK